ncbi:hypothetical protein D038_1653B, partial [Vibrio parahaemolyticus IDH02189]
RWKKTDFRPLVFIKSAKIKERATVVT